MISRHLNFLNDMLIFVASNSVHNVTYTIRYIDCEFYGYLSLRVKRRLVTLINADHFLKEQTKRKNQNDFISMIIC
jgi:hypothetical protein